MQEITKKYKFLDGTMEIKEYLDNLDMKLSATAKRLQRYK
jgi:hypothetical protein